MILFAALAGIALSPHQSVAAEIQPVHLHDPHIIRCGNSYYIFSTGPGIPILRSEDLLHWRHVGRVFKSDLPAWAKMLVPDATGIWAPDIFQINGQFYLYYTVSTFGLNQSCIGLATNVTLDPESPDYRWEDRGLVIKSLIGDDFNAIDAGPFCDQQGKPWLVFGSFWSGIQLIPLDATTGKPASNANRRTIAARPDVSDHPIEAPYMIYRNGYYYLFVSFDFCARSVNSTYKIMVGRSQSVTGPFVDANGKPLLRGGGTTVLESRDHIRGPGHNSILSDKDRYYLVNHYYDARAEGRPTLMISPLTWDADGWPHPENPLPITLIGKP